MDNKLREMDVKVHNALYPDDIVRVCGDDFEVLRPTAREVWHGHGTEYQDMALPHYTTDLADWEPIYALKPEWMWDTIEFYGHTDTVLFYDVWREDPLPSIEVNVPWDDARGLAAYALGRARCVIAWAEAQHGG